jgi:predicted MFS family arabinose efflux permease
MAFLKNTQLIKMNITNFLQKGMMTFAFMMIPIILTKTYNWELSQLWKIYLVSMIAGILSMAPSAILAEKKGKFKEILLIGIVFFALSYYLIGNASQEIYFLSGIIVFFIGFNMHEPIMQSLTTRYIKVYEKGKVLGLFNSFGYLGTFVGGFVGGLYLKEVDGSFLQSVSNISMIIIIICAIWFVLILTLPNPTKKKNIYIPLDMINQNNCDKLDNLNGCDEWYINDTENIIIIKYDEDIVNEDEINNILQKIHNKE